MAMFLFASGVLENMVGDVLYLGGPNSEEDDQQMSPVLDYFILMFPPEQLSAIVQLT
jgi:hypothetical protein